MVKFIANIHLLYGRDMNGKGGINGLLKFRIPIRNH